MFRDWTIELLYVFDWLVTSTLTIVNNMLTTPLDSFAPGAFALSEAIATSLTGFGLAILTLLWMVDFAGSTFSFRIKNLEEIVKLFIMLILGAVIVRASFWIVIYVFNGLQFVLNIVNQVAGTTLNNSTSLNFSYFVQDTQEFVRSLGSRQLGESMILFLFIAMFLLGAFGAMLSIILVPITIMIELYIYSAFAPIPLATLTTSQRQIGIQFLKTYAGVCIRGALVIFGLFLSQAFLSSNILNISNITLEGILVVFVPILQLFLNIMILQKCIKSAEQFSKVLVGG